MVWLIVLIFAVFAFGFIIGGAFARIAYDEDTAGR